MKISNSRINNIIEKILFNTYDTSLSHEEKRNLIFEKIGIKDNSLKVKYKDKIDNKIKKIGRQISEYYSVSDSSSNFSDSSSSQSQSSFNSSSSSEISGNFKISSSNINYPKKKMTVAEKKILQKTWSNL